MKTLIIAFLIFSAVTLLVLGIAAYRTPVSSKPWEPGDE